MRLYSRTGAVALEDPEYGRFEAKKDGTFDLPDELAERELSFHDRGRPRWETEIDRQRRITSDDLDRSRDPAALLEAVQQILAAAKLAAAATAASAPPEAREEESGQVVTTPAKTAAKKTTAPKPA